MNVGYTDIQLAQEISRLEAAIQKWSEERDLWFDSGFKEFLQQWEKLIQKLCPHLDILP